MSVIHYAEYNAGLFAPLKAAAGGDKLTLRQDPYFSSASNQKAEQTERQCLRFLSASVAPPDRCVLSPLSVHFID